jgi:hypothetical protein
LNLLKNGRINESTPVHAIGKSYSVQSLLSEPPRAKLLDYVNVLVAFLTLPVCLICLFFGFLAAATGLYPIALFFGFFLLVTTVCSLIGLTICITRMFQPTHWLIPITTAIYLLQLCVAVFVICII